jgi:hypothetical protein
MWSLSSCFKSDPTEATEPIEACLVAEFTDETTFGGAWPPESWARGEIDEVAVIDDDLADLGPSSPAVEALLTAVLGPIEVVAGTVVAVAVGVEAEDRVDDVIHDGISFGWYDYYIMQRQILHKSGRAA